MSKLGSFAQHRKLQLLLLLLHLVLRLEQDLDEFGQRLFAGHTSEVSALNFVPANLLSSARGTAIVLEAAA